MKVFLVVLIVFSYIFCTAQNDIYEWGEGLTSYKGRFDTAKYSYGQLDSIHRYLFDWPSDISGTCSIWKIEQMDSVSTTKIDAFYADRMKIYDSISAPRTEFWDSLIIYRKKELSDIYIANREYLNGFINPSSLLNLDYPDCQKYSIAMNGTGEEMLAGWGDLIDEMKKNNCCPERLDAKYQKELESPFKLKYARLDLMKFGWWNCRNKYIYYHEDFSRIEEEFEKLFISVERFDEE